MKCSIPNLQEVPKGVARGKRRRKGRLGESSRSNESGRLNFVLRRFLTALIFPSHATMPPRRHASSHTVILSEAKELSAKTRHGFLRGPGAHKNKIARARFDQTRATPIQI